MIAPGYFAQNGPVGWAVWFTHALLQRTLVSTYPVYASIVTPTFLRLLGARVGRGTEISTVETIPHLTVIEDGAFLADHALATGTRGRCGWLHVGTTLIGERSFVGNSAIVGPDRDVPGDTWWPCSRALRISPGGAPRGWGGAPRRSLGSSSGPMPPAPSIRPCPCVWPAPGWRPAASCRR